MSTYANTLKVKDALPVYFSQYHFKDGGYNLKWFKIKLGRFFIPLPNIKARVDAVKIHDVNHLITEYTADYKGEAEIGAWEIASGCGKYYVAWILNLGSFFIGMFLYPGFLLRAFLRGRKCANSLYNHPYDEALLNKTIGELRQIIEMDASKKSSLKDYCAFALWCFISLCYHTGIVFLFFFAIYKMYILLF
ncbi:MAG TPA: hypothetical protein VJY62_16445 [Bacteroidia bacterium]|nr:hypothetical protein [Bacteroidia bacterium]